MITSENLTDIFQLFAQGLAIGIPLGMLPFLIGYGIESIYSIIKKFS